MAESKRLWDQRMADRATAIDQATKLGGVVIKPEKPPTGFAAPGPPESEGDRS